MNRLRTYNNLFRNNILNYTTQTTIKEEKGNQT